MPRLTSALPKYRKHRASGKAVVTIAGRDVYLGPYGTKASRTEYDRVIAEWIAAGRPSTVVPTKAEITVTEVMAAYWRFVRAEYVKDGEPTSQQALTRAALKPLMERYGKQPAIEFGPLALKAVRASFVEAGFVRRTVNAHVETVKRMFKWAASEELVPESIHRSLTTVTGLREGKTEAPDNPPVGPVADADVEATLPHLPPIVADMVRLQRLTGMRPTEVCILRPVDLDRSRDVWRYLPSSHKTKHRGKGRTVFIGPKAQSLLTPYLDRAGDAYCFSPLEAEAARLEARHLARKTPAGYGNRPGTNDSGKRRASLHGRYDRDSYRRAVTRSCEKAGLDPWTPNRLRHAAATAIRSGFGLEAAQVTLGHVRADITEVYAERDAALAERIAREQG